MNRRAEEAAPEIEVSIDELVLHGFSGIDRGRLDAALRDELGRLLRDAQLSAALRKFQPAAPLNLGMLAVRDSASPEQLGVAVARALVHSWQPAASAAARPHGPNGGAGHEKGRRP